MVKVVAPFMRSPEKGAETIIHLASSPDVQDVTVEYFSDKTEKRSSKESYDMNVAKRLWEISEKLTSSR